MTLRQLHARLTAVMQDNEARGYGYCNDLPVVHRLRRGRNDWWVPVESVWGGRISVGGTTFGGEIIGNEAEAIKLGTRTR